MGIGVLACCLNCRAQASHFGFTGIVEIGQSALGLEIICFGIVWHFHPIDSANKFAPAQYLANKALNGVDRCLMGVQARFRRPANLQRIKQTQINARPDKAVINEGLAGFHGVLIIAKHWQAIIQKIFKVSFGFFPGDGPCEIFELAKMV